MSAFAFLHGLIPRSVDAADTQLDNLLLIFFRVLIRIASHSSILFSVLRLLSMNVPLTINMCSDSSDMPLGLRSRTSDRLGRRAAASTMVGCRNKV